ncbi:MAG: hypothetical protein AAGA68_24895 [Pseudomonadota bacterium]
MERTRMVAAHTNVAEIKTREEAARFAQEYHDALVRQLRLTASRQAREAANGDWSAFRRSGERLEAIAERLSAPGQLPRIA